MIDFFKKNRVAIFLSLLIVFVLGVFLLALSSAQKTTNTSQQTPAPTQIPARTPLPTNIPAHEIPQGTEVKSWMFSLPLQNPNYYVDYDGATNTIQAYLSTFYSRSVSREEQAEFLKTRIQERLKDLGVDLSEEKIEWTIQNN